MSRLTFTLKQRLALAYLALCALSILLAILGLWSTEQANARAKALYDTVTRPGHYVQTSSIMTLGRVIQLMESLAIADERVRTERLQLIKQLHAASDAQFDLFERSEKSPAIQPMASNLVIEHRRFSAALSRAEHLLESGDAQKAIEVETEEVRPAGVAFFENVMNFSSLLDAETQAAHERDDTSYRHSMTLMASLLVTGGLAVGLYAWTQLRLIGRSIRGIQTALHDTCQKLDLTLRAPVARHDEIGQTAIAFNQLMDRVSAVLATVRTSADSVALASREIATGNADLSTRTGKQAVALEETSASMHELTNAVTQNSLNARQAASLAVVASDTAQRGSAVVNQVVGVMQDINTSSARIAEITGMIESIAFQTNILALNAAVEAARAGEQGRGFAVVAAEVRSLSQRTGTAAKEIKDLIDVSVSVCAEGHRLVSVAGETMAEINDAVERVTNIMSEIGSASDEQSRGIGHVAQAVSQVDDVTQQNAALVEKSAAAASSMEEQAANLRNAIDVFGLTDRSGGSRAVLVS
jgi:methyl-accepting chemotaxis protein